MGAPVLLPPMPYLRTVGEVDEALTRLSERTRQIEADSGDLDELLVLARLRDELLDRRNKLTRETA